MEKLFFLEPSMDFEWREQIKLGKCENIKLQNSNEY